MVLSIVLLRHSAGTDRLALKNLKVIWLSEVEQIHGGSEPREA